MIKIDFDRMMREVHNGRIQSTQEIKNYLESMKEKYMCKDFGFAVGINDTVAHKIDEKFFEVGDVLSIDTWFLNSTGDLWVDGAGTVIYKSNVTHETIAFTHTAVYMAVEFIREKIAEQLVEYRSGKRKREDVRLGFEDYGIFVEDLEDKYIKNDGNYRIIRGLCGHNITHEIHGGLRICNYKAKEYKQEDAFTLDNRYAIEILVSGNGEFDRETWKTTDKSISAHSEVTIDISELGVIKVYGYDLLDHIYTNNLTRS